MDEIRTDRKYISREAFGKSKKGRLCGLVEKGLIFGIGGYLIIGIGLSLVMNDPGFKDQPEPYFLSLPQLGAILIFLLFSLGCWIGYISGYPFFLHIFFKTDEKSIKAYVQKSIDKLIEERTEKENAELYLRRKFAREIEKAESDTKIINLAIETLRKNYLD
jgi:hypothetical protein